MGARGLVFAVEGVAEVFANFGIDPSATNNDLSEEVTALGLNLQLDLQAECPLGVLAYKIIYIAGAVRAAGAWNGLI